ncbi:DUF4268 domain-containing protein [Salegentibacter sp. BDJ18]|uniref:DUF4268 domain-containing protein n=1 Tax=Salegentibacter sp. BDJ18 TaxID=2816376 RepID=UPI001AAF429B|nr:DUF4268 domain-containing protein [Salegentibacter sp. BDJ18]MBO2545470.1 DUF4268 domain-containing protein [Salegentibacter sp. BDJ18]|tara:strand:- start:389 stop:814 length:426 start_codon:yes stop_codon:yes gene_type:complete
MFSKAESKKLRQQFWTSFGIVFRRKWLLYNTGIKELELKFTFNRKFAQVSIDVIDEDPLIREYYFEKLLSLKKILTTEYLPNSIFEEEYELPEGKVISRVYVQLDGVSIHNRNQWPEAMKFLNDNMEQMEAFFVEYKDLFR